jgi:hypothetical protein
MDDLENQLTDMFGAAASGVTPPLEEILDASTKQGRVLRRRRTAGIAAATAGLVGLSAGVGLGVYQLGFHNARPDAAAAGNSSTPTPGPRSPTPTVPPHSVTPTAASTPTTQTTPSASGSLPGAYLTSAPTEAAQSGLGLLESILAQYRGSVVPVTQKPLGVAEVNYDDGGGASQIVVWVVTNVQTPASGGFDCGNFHTSDAGPRPSGAPAASCTQVTTADGLPEFLLVSGTSYDTGFYEYQVIRFVSADEWVSMDVGNGVFDDGPIDVTRAVPPLSLEQMQTVVANPGWTSLSGS